MTSKRESPLRPFAQNSPKKLQQENGSSHGAYASLPAGRHPLCPISSEAGRKVATEQVEPGSSPPKLAKPEPSTPRGKKRGASAYRQSENVDGNVGSASNTPEKPREKRTAQAAAVKARSTWQYKQPASHGLEIPSTSTVRRSPSFSRSLQESLRTDPNKSTDSDPGVSTPTKIPRNPAQLTVPNSGPSKSGAAADQTPRGSRIGGKPPLDSDSSKAASSSNSSFSLTPTRSVTRSLRYGAMPASAGGLGSAVNVASTRGSTGSVAKSVGALVSQPSVEQHFDVEEDPTFWKDHNVQVILRTRPISTSESAVKGFSRCVRQDSAHTITWIGQPESRFTFDHVAGELITQEKLFRVAGVPMVENCMAGYNSCMFCYGQTGSGKTHTMLGDIVDLEHRPSENRGITPRVFEYLFAKIRMEEEARKHERLKYVCKCSFLEIFNEQITDLLEPTSTNLQMREDGKKGVYVENLSEVEVRSVQDVVHLLLLGAANRKVAATNMNRESSRSHSVFTCIIESKWEFDSITNIRFGRLNLVDLAGSERQKNSGAEGERLKEAANINKSLSTLGLVIMILVDVANGKQRHVPYRDSKLTYLLQDSLGGNSKTTMIANISPSSCCALETLSTLKFAQRAKFIRNNAVVNEDASGDVSGLRQEIQELKEELDRMRRQGVSRTPSMRLIASPSQDSLLMGDHSLGMAMVTVDGQDQARCSLDSWEYSKALTGPRMSYKKVKAMEAVLAGALRREQAAELAQKRLAAEIEQLNRLVKQREDDTQCSKMMLRFREDKIKRLESLSGGLLPADSYLVQEKDLLTEELQLIQAKIERNPELTRFAMENIRLLEQLRRFQDFYTGGEREAMADEISNLRDQLLEVLDSKLSLDALTSPQREALAPELASAKREIELLRIEADNYQREVEECRKNLSASLEANSKAAKQLDEANIELHGVKLECQVHQKELEKLQERALDLEAVEWGHAQHVELISKLKARLQQSEERAGHEASVRIQVEEQLKASLLNACYLQAELQETRGALDAAETLAIRLQAAESSLAVAQEAASSAQEAVEEIRLEMKAMAEEQCVSLKNIEDAAVAARMKESELREELAEAQSLIEKLSSSTKEDLEREDRAAPSGEDDMRSAAAVMRMQLELEWLDLACKGGCSYRRETVHKTERIGSKALEGMVAALCDKEAVVDALENRAVLGELEVLRIEHWETQERLRRHEEGERGLKAKVLQLEQKLLQKEQEGCSHEKQCTAVAELREEQDLAELHEEIMKLKQEVALAEQRKAAAKGSVTEIVEALRKLKLVVRVVQEESKNWAAQNGEKDAETGNWLAATARLLERLDEGEYALIDAVRAMEGILADSLAQTEGHDEEQQAWNPANIAESQAPALVSGPRPRPKTPERMYSTVCSILLWWLSEKLDPSKERMEEAMSEKDSLISRLQADLGRGVANLGEKEMLLSELQRERDWVGALLEEAEAKVETGLSVEAQLHEELDEHRRELATVFKGMECTDVVLAQMQGEVTKLQVELISCEKKREQLAADKEQLAADKEQLAAQLLEDAATWAKSCATASTMVWWLQTQMAAVQEERDGAVLSLRSEVDRNSALLKERMEKLEFLLGENRRYMLDIEEARSTIKGKDLALEAARSDVVKLQEDLVACEARSGQLALAKGKLEVEVHESEQALEALKEQVTRVEGQLHEAEGKAAEMAAAKAGMAVAHEEWSLEKEGLEVDAKNARARSAELEQELETAHRELQAEVREARARQTALCEARNRVEAELQGALEAWQMRADGSERELEMKEKRLAELDALLVVQVKEWEAERESMLAATRLAQHQCLEKDEALLSVLARLTETQSQMDGALARETALSQCMEELLQSKEDADGKTQKLNLEVEELGCLVRRLGDEISMQEAAIEGKLRRAEAMVEGAHRQMAAMLTEMDVFALAKEKLEGETDRVEEEVAEHCRSLEEELEGAWEEKRQIEDLSAAHENRLVEELNAAHAESAALAVHARALGEALEGAAAQAAQKEEAAAVARRGAAELEAKLKEVCEKLGASTVLVKELTLSEERWRSEKEALAAESKRLKSCMACREMEFVALQGQKVALETSLQVAHEHMRAADAKLEAAEAERRAEREQLSEHLARVNRELLANRVQGQGYRSALQALQEQERAAATNYAALAERLGELEAQWTLEREGMASHLAKLSVDCLEVTSGAQKARLDLAEARSLVAAADAGIQHLLDKSAVLQDGNEQLRAEHEALRRELSCWDHYAAELCRTIQYAPSPRSESRALAAGESRPASAHFDGLKREVERTRRECEKLRAQALDKDGAILSAQMDLAAAAASGRQAEHELEKVITERQKLEHELHSTTRELSSAQGEVRAREGHAAQLGRELCRVMETLAVTEAKLDEREREWRRRRADLEAEREAARLDACEKGGEASALRRQFEDGQATLQEAELLIDALVRVHESAKRDAMRWKQKKEAMARRSSAMLAVLEEEVSASMGHVERDIQALGSEIHEMRALLEGGCHIDAAAGFHRELKEAFAVLTAKLTDSEERVYKSAVETEILQIMLKDADESLATLQVGLENATREAMTQRTGWVAAHEELQAAAAFTAEQETHILGLSLERDSISARVADLERLYTDTCQELAVSSEKLRELEMEKLAMGKAARRQAVAMDDLRGLIQGLEASVMEKTSAKEAKEMEVVSLARHNESLKTRIKILVAELGALHDALEAATAKLMEKDATIEALSTDDENCCSEVIELDDLRRQVRKSVESEARLQADIDAQNYMLEGAESQIAQLKAEAESAAAVQLRIVSDLGTQILQLEVASQAAGIATSRLELELEIVATMLESTGRELGEKDAMATHLKSLLEQSRLQNAVMFETLRALEDDKRELEKGMEAQVRRASYLETQVVQLHAESQAAGAASTQQEAELESVRTMLESASSELREKDDMATALRSDLEQSHVQAAQALESLQAATVASSQLKLEGYKLVETVGNLEVERWALKEDLGGQISTLEAKLQEARSAQRFELEILATVLESAAGEVREREAMAAQLDKLLEHSRAENMQMLESSQEIVGHFALFQSQLDSSFQQVGKLKREKLELTAEVQSHLQAVADLREQMRACEGALEALRASSSQWEEQKDVEVRTFEDEVEALRSQEAVLEADLWEWQRRAHKAEAQLDDRDAALAGLLSELLAAQEEFKEAKESLDEELQQSRRHIVKVEFARDALVTEIEGRAAMLQEKLQANESALEEHLASHCIELEAVESLEHEAAELKRTSKELACEAAANQRRAAAAEHSLGEARLEIEVLGGALKQKEELLQGLESDISLLQESALQELHLKQESEALRAAVQTLQQELGLQKERRAKLEAELAQVTEEALQIRNQAANWKGRACALETELDMKRQVIESLEDELQMVEHNMANALEDATGDLKEVENERDRLQTEMLVLTEQLEMAQAMVDERDAVASEARLIAELSKTHAEEKEEEAKLLSRSVEELESTVYALESQLGLLKRETERQRLMREDMEMELQTLNNHIFMMQAALDESCARSAEELKEAQAARKESERKVEEKESEMLHLQQKLENLQIGAGLPPQTSSETDAERFSYQCRIEELESLAASRQKEVFLLNTRLAEAESMTHDVLRDLLGVKLDITSVASMLGQQQVQQLAESARRKNAEAAEKDTELSILKSQFNDLIEEKEGWLDEINQRQCEMVAARVAAEKLRQREQALIEEVEKCKAEGASQQERIKGLELEVNRLSTCQPSFQQQINHHSRTKEENQSLRTANEELSGHLRHTELLLAQVNAELVQYRAAAQAPNIDEEQCLRRLLQEAEHGRAQTAQKLVSLCTAIMQAAGLSGSGKDADPLAAMDALLLLEDRLHSTEQELSDTKMKTRIAGEKRRLRDLKAKQTPLRSIGNNFTSQLQRAGSPSPAPR